MNGKHLNVIRRAPPVHFTVVHADHLFVYLVDDDKGGMSVTNAAARVVAALISQGFGGRRFVYRDSMKEWAELKHDGLRFTGFAPRPAECEATLRQLA